MFVVAFLLGIGAIRSSLFDSVRLREKRMGRSGHLAERAFSEIISIPSRLDQKELFPCREIESSI
jgi:hypothetical protein